MNGSLSSLSNSHLRCGKRIKNDIFGMRNDSELGVGLSPQELMPESIIVYLKNGREYFDVNLRGAFFLWRLNTF